MHKKVYFRLQMVPLMVDLVVSCHSLEESHQCSSVNVCQNVNCFWLKNYLHLQPRRLTEKHEQKWQNSNCVFAMDGSTNRQLCVLAYCMFLLMVHSAYVHIPETLSLNSFSGDLNVFDLKRLTEGETSLSFLRPTLTSLSR